MAGAELSRAGTWLPVSLLLHAALLAAALARGGEPATSGAAATARTAGGLSVRLAAAPTATTPARSERTARDRPPSMPEPAPDAAPEAAPDPLPDPVPQPLPPPGAGQPQAAVEPMPSPGETEPDDDSTYLAPDQLDRRAHAVAAIDLPYPDLAPPGHFRAALTLFIEHDGRVSRVRLEPDPHAPGGGALPPVLEDSARQAFLASLFEPGELGGRAVRSRLRIEVEFRED